MITWLENYAKTHLFYLILIAVGAVSFRCWLSEHDARQAAEASMKQADAQVKTLQQQIVTTNQQASAKVQTVVKIVHDAVTPAQQIAAIPQLTQTPLNARQAPDGGVIVDLAPLVAELGQCKQYSINLGACTSNYNTCQQIVKERENEVSTLKQKPGFWKRITSHGKTATVAIVVFEVVKVLLTKQI